MRLFSGKSLKGLFFKKGQITLVVVWRVLVIFLLVLAVIILFNVRGMLSNYLAKFYDCMRFGGCFG